MDVIPASAWTTILSAVGNFRDVVSNVALSSTYLNRLVKEISASQPLLNVVLNTDDRVHEYMYVGACFGYEDIVKLLVNTDVMHNKREKFAHIFKIAVLRGNRNIVRIILEHAPYLATMDRCDLIRWVSKNGYKEEVQMLLDAGADVRTVKYYTPYTHGINSSIICRPLLYAGAGNSDLLKPELMGGYSNLVSVLSTRANSISDFDYILRCQTRNKHVEMVRFLLSSNL
jgi:hypothetical protein